MNTLKLGNFIIGSVSGASMAVRNFKAVPIDIDGEDITYAHITWTASSKYETEIWRSLDGGVFALLTTIGLNIGQYDDHLFDGNEHTADYYLRFKQDLTVLNAPNGLTTTIIDGGVRIDGNVNNTDAEYIILEANIDSAGYYVLSNIAISGNTFTYNHSIIGTHSIIYRARAKEGTLPIYSDYSSTASQNTQIVDQDGNVYTEVVIGTQTWLVENFKSTKYKDGSTIAIGADATARKNDTSGMMAYPNNDINNKSAYGCLYNWYAIKNVAGFGITGYKVPSQAEFNTLITYLGGSTIAGKHLKETGTTYWEATGGDNTVGFKHRGAGRVDGSTGNFGNFKNQGVLYTNETTQASIRVYASLDLTQAGDAIKSAQLSVRLIKI